MVEPLSVNTDGVRSLGDIHAGVATGLGSLTAGAPGSAEVAMSHGTIASGVDTALTAALGSRSGSMTMTQTSAETISELLHQAAMAYERGDQHGAEAIRAAADALARGETSADGGTATGSATSAGSAGPAGGTDAIGQAVGQLGQLGQLGQQLVAPLAALAQPLQQLPQQVMQGIQQMMQSATQSAGSDKAPVPGSDNAPAPEDRDPKEHTPPEPGSGDQAHAPVDEQAAPGAPSGTGAAPVAPERQPEPAPTRPPID